MNTTIYTHYFETGLNSCPFLGFNVSATDESLVGVSFVFTKEQRRDNDGQPTEALELTRTQLCAYLSGNLREFSIPLFLNGTEFQRNVWNEMAKIPFGQVKTYGEIAKELGDVKLSRAVGQAANKNPIPVIVPCHRVVGSGGKLTGFAPGLPAKSFLLAHEKGGMLWG